MIYIYIYIRVNIFAQLTLEPIDSFDDSVLL